jgi:hypothetical protein
MDKQDIMKIYSNYVDTKRRITITGRSDFYEYKNNRKGTKGNRFNKKLY